jgi:signal transduction histidine kinase
MRIQTKNFEGQGQLGSITRLELVKAKSAIEQFIYSCSHTLRAPLKSIAGLVYLLKNSDTHKDIDPKFFLESIEKTVEKMELVLNDLELFLSNSRHTVTTQVVDVKSVVREVIAGTQPLHGENKIDFSIACQQPVPFFSDKNRLEIVLSHVVSNAIQFQDESKGKIKIGIQIKVTSSSCSIHVRDNGIGISSSVLPHIFQLFYRGSNKSTGSGVGLYIVKEVLNKMGGTIIVRSTESKGSTFHISIPNLVP